MKRFVALALSVILCGLCSGCLSRTEIVDIAIIQSIGVDFAGGEYTLTLQRFSSNGGDKGVFQKDLTPESMVTSVKGASIPSALEKVSLGNGQQLYLGNIQVIVIGMDTAVEGTEDILCYFNEDARLRPSVNVVVSDGTAFDFITKPMEKGILPSVAVSAILAGSDHSSTIAPASLMKVISALAGEGSDPYLPVMALGEEARPELIGTAVLSRGKLAGILTPYQTSGLAFIRGLPKVCPITVTNSKNIETSVELSRIKALTDVSIANGVPVLKVTVGCSGSISQSAGSITSSDIAILEDAVNSELATMMQSAWDAAMLQSGGDVFALGKLLKQRQPVYWKENSQSFGTIAKSTTVVFAGDCKIDRVGG